VREKKKSISIYLVFLVVVVVVKTKSIFWWWWWWWSVTIFSVSGQKNGSQRGYRGHQNSSFSSF
jgi:hypothetical protein